VIPSHANELRRKLADLFAACPVDATVSYGDMEQELGFDVRNRYRHLIYAALKLVSKENGALFVGVNRVGYRRLPASELHVVGHASRKSIRRKAARASRAIGRGVSASNSISNSARIKAMSEIAALGIIQHVARDATVKVIKSAHRPISTAKIVRATLESIRATQERRT